MRTPRRLGSPLAAFLTLAMAAMLLLPGSALASSPKRPRVALSAPSEVDMANDRCSVASSPTTCGGGFTSNVTFRATPKVGDLVTVTFAYLYGNSGNATLSFDDTLGNVPVLASSQCSPTSPIICSAVGYFYVANGGADDVLFTVTGGSAGEIWYNVEIWQGQFSRTLGAVGVTSFCASACSGGVETSPLNVTGASTVVAVSAYAAFYPYTPATWVPKYYYSYSCTDFSGAGGDSILWQGSTSLLGVYTFGASTSPTPLAWAGSAEVIYVMR